METYERRALSAPSQTRHIHAYSTQCKYGPSDGNLLRLPSTSATHSKDAHAAACARGAQPKRPGRMAWTATRKDRLMRRVSYFSQNALSQNAKFMGSAQVYART